MLETVSIFKIHCFMVSAELRVESAVVGFVTHGFCEASISPREAVVSWQCFEQKISYRCIHESIMIMGKISRDVDVKFQLFKNEMMLASNFLL